MLERKVVSYTLQSGVDESTSPEALQPGQLLTAENVRFRKDGSVEKRKGHVGAFETIGGAYGLTSREGRLVANGDELLLIDGYNVASCSNLPSLDSTNVCKAPKYAATTSTIAAPNANLVSCTQSYCQSSTGQRMLVCAFSTQTSPLSSVGGTAYVQVYDLDTEAPLTSVGNLASNSRLNTNTDVMQLWSVNVNSRYVVVTYTRAGAGNIYARSFDADTRSWSVETSLTADNMVIGGVANTYCIAPVAGGPYFVLVYNKASDGKIKVAKLDLAWVYANQVDMAETAGALYPPNGFGACCTAGEKVYVTYGWDPNDGSGQRCKLARLDYTTWTLDGGFPLIVNAPGVFANKGAAILASGVSRDANSTTVMTAYGGMCDATGAALFTSPATWQVQWFIKSATVTGTTVGTVNTLGNARLLSAPFYRGTRHYAACQRDTGEFFGQAWADVQAEGLFGGYNGLQQGTCAVVELGSVLDDCVLFPDELAVTDGFSTFRPTLQHVVAGIEAFVVPTWRTVGKTKNVKLARLTTSDKYRYQPAYAQGGAYIGGGLVAAYDGVSLYPVGFVTDPIWLRAGQTSGLGGSGWAHTAGTSKYYFQVIFERTDARGRISYSTQDFGTKKSALTSPDFVITDTSYVVPSAASSSIQLIFPGPTDGWDSYAGWGRNKAVVYASFTPSAGADPQGSSSLRRWNTYNSFGPNTLALNPAVLAVATPAADAPQPYTIGGALGHTQPPCLLSLVNYRNRLFGLTHDRRTLRFTKETLVNEVPGWPLEFNLPIPFAAECLGVLDDKLIVFGQNSIGVLIGDGPNDAGQGSQYGDINILATDRGCIDSRSVVLTPNGLMYQSSSGICLLDRSLNVNLIGQPVKDALAAYPVVTSAILHPSETTVLFSCMSSGGGASIRLVYDYRLGRWSKDILLDGCPIISMAVCRGTVFVHTYNCGGNARAQVWQESTSTNLDNGTWVTLKVKLAATRLNNLFGYQRVWKAGVVGTSTTDHNLVVSVYGDERSSADQTRTYPRTTTSLTGPERVELRVRRQLCRGLAVEVSDATPTGGTVGAGTGPTISGIGLEIGVLPDMARTPATRRA